MFYYDLRQKYNITMKARSPLIILLLYLFLTPIYATSQVGHLNAFRGHSAGIDEADRFRIEDQTRLANYFKQANQFIHASQNQAVAPKFLEIHDLKKIPENEIAGAQQIKDARLKKINKLKARVDQRQNILLRRDEYLTRMQSKINSQIQQYQRRVTEYQGMVENVTRQLKTEKSSCLTKEQSLSKSLQGITEMLSNPNIEHNERTQLYGNMQRIEQQKDKLNTACQEYITKQQNWVIGKATQLKLLAQAINKTMQSFEKKEEKHKISVGKFNTIQSRIIQLEDLVQLEALHQNINENTNFSRIEILKKQEQLRRASNHQNKYVRVTLPPFPLTPSQITKSKANKYFSIIEDKLSNRYTSENTPELKKGIMFFLNERASSGHNKLNKFSCERIRQFLTECPSLNQDTDYTELVDILQDMFEEDCVAWGSIEAIQKGWRYGEIPLGKDGTKIAGEFETINGTDYKIISRNGLLFASPVAPSIEEDDEQGKLTMVQKRFGAIQYPKRHPLGRNPTKPRHLRLLRSGDFKRINNIFSVFSSKRPFIGEGGVDMHGKIFIWDGRKWAPSTMNQIRQKAKELCKKVSQKQKWVWDKQQKTKKQQDRAKRRLEKKNEKQRMNMIKKAQKQSTKTEIKDRSKSKNKKKKKKVTKIYPSRDTPSIEHEHEFEVSNQRPEISQNMFRRASDSRATVQGDQIEINNKRSSSHSNRPVLTRQDSFDGADSIDNEKQTFV